MYSLLLYLYSTTVQVCWSICRQGDTFSVSYMTSLSLPPSKHRWISAVAIPSNLHCHSSIRSESQTAVILCGDRKGSLHMYHCTFEPSKAVESLTYQDPVQSLRLHGPNGVTSIVNHGGYIYTAGRDGYCRKFSFGSDGLLIELSKHKVHCIIVGTCRRPHSKAPSSYACTCTCRSQ